MKTVCFIGRVLSEEVFLLMWIVMVGYAVLSDRHLYWLAIHGSFIVVLMVVLPLVDAWGYNYFFRRKGEQERKPRFKRALYIYIPWISALLILGILMYSAGIRW